MSSITKRPNGHRWVQFVDGKKRKTIRLGDVTLSQAREVRRHVDRILASRITGEPIDGPTVRWLATVEGQLRDRLAAVGLVSHRAHTLGDLIEYAIGQYEGGKPNTLRNMRWTSSWLLKFFDSATVLTLITPGDADDFRRFLRSEGLSPTSETSLCRKSRRFFSMAVDKRWLQENPFRGMKSWTHTNDSRQFFVDRPTFKVLLDACEPEWQLIFALVRYGGLRCPSEIRSLRWDWINLPERKMSIFSTKNEKHVTKRFRICPIFPELEPYLATAWDRAADRTEFVVTRNSSNSALYNAATKRLARAGITPWPKLFVNLRASRETELVEEFPIHVVTSWLGNSPSIAQAHYLQVTNDHFLRATRSKIRSGDNKKAKQNAKQ